jgi:[ribosomal protein S5]-alanine N-acetyltransferase
LKIQSLQIDKLTTERLILVPFTTAICKDIMNDDFSKLYDMGLRKGLSWPDDEAMETMPRILNNLSKVEAPTGFESWMIIKKDTVEIIGDLGFKGFNYEEKNADIGYGIIKEERQKGYAKEAATAIIQWAFSNSVLKEITASCSIDNLSSINLLEKMNFIKIKKENEMFYWSLQNSWH